MNIHVAIVSSLKDTIVDTVHSLLVCENPKISSITIVGTLSPQTAHVAEHEQVRYVDWADGPFRKAACLNVALRRMNDGLVLVSDADIIWSESAVAALVDGASGDRICHIRNVEESNPTRSEAANRFQATVDHGSLGASVMIASVPVDRSVRPGPGLVMASASIFHDIGGYNEELAGWGWEDQDLLIRAQLLHYRVRSAGTVLHLSHGDVDRNRAHGYVSPLATRNANILRSCRRIGGGGLWGDLRVEGNLKDRVAPRVTVNLPEDLR